MPLLSDIRVPLDRLSDLTAVAANALGVRPKDVTSVAVLRRSLDARGHQARWVLSLAVGLRGDPAPVPPPLPIVPPPVRSSSRRILIVGAGPAGRFAALRCADAGLRCTVLDRGGALRDRHSRSRRLRAHGELDAETNLCFGEGGAGTYSDGKLYTRKKDPRVREVYERLVAFGADPAILVDAHPHVGTNELIPVLGTLHQWLEERGTTFRFDTRLDDLHIEGGRLRGVQLRSAREGGELEYLEADAVVLATGHSARDTYEMLARHGVAMTSKPFAVGARVEHPQALIDRAQLGQNAGHPDVGAAEYFLKCQLGERGVYSFCMCPGGFIIPTPTEPGHLNVNGMSNASRANGLSNAALVVTTDPRDHSPSGDPLEGLRWQRAIERRTFLAGGGGYAAPATRLQDFADGRGSSTLPARSSYRPSLTAGDVAEVLPDFVTRAIRQALRRFEHQLAGYLTNEAVLVASETTTSSPIRVTRDEGLESPTVRGLYPAGEGAGYAGGIVSSALDGMRAVEAALAAP